MFELREGGEHLRGERRTLEIADPTPISIAPRRQSARPGASFPVELRGPPRAILQMAAYTEHHFDEQPARITLDGRGRGRAVFHAPREETVLTVLAFDKTSGDAAWAAVEVR